MRVILLFAVLGFFAFNTFAQTDTTSNVAEEFNFDDFGNVDDKPIKTFCTQKVNYLSPARLISIGYEGQGDFHFYAQNGTNNPESHVNSVGGFRFAVNAPVISKSSIIVNLGLSYWNSRFNFENPERSPLFKNLNQLNSLGLNTTIFKPLNNKNFLILQASGDVNGNYQKPNEIDTKGLTYSAALLYGWKKNDNLMWALGVSRTYRAGQVLHIPAILYNKTFNNKWGIEALLPARAHVRRTFNPNTLLTAGFEIEGNAYFVGQVNNQDTFIRRGELKPRINFEKKLAGFVWVALQAGWRYNYRFDGFTTLNPTKNQEPIFVNTLGNPLFFNVSINLVSP
jgi:hypothetical protein